MKTVFVVDDDEFVRNMFMGKFSDEIRYDMHYFSTGEDCLNKMHLKPKAIILDFYLDSVNPEAQNGLEILKKIYAQDKNVKVIILSSQTHYANAARTLAHGAIEYVAKDNDCYDRIENILKSIR